MRKVIFLAIGLACLLPCRSTGGETVDVAVPKAIQEDLFHKKFSSGETICLLMADGP